MSSNSDMRQGLLGILLLFWSSAAVIRAQTQNPATPQHPIDTRPEGQGQSCSYSVTRGSGTTTGTSSCPQPEAGGASAAQRFPFPGETGIPGDAPAETNPANSRPGGSPDAPQPPSAAKRFPYPGEETKPSSNPLQDAGSSGQSTSSSSSSSSDSALPPEDEAPNGADALPAPKRARKKLPPVPRQSPDEREEEDVRVAGFYQNDGNFRAAYMRAKDAVGLADDDAEAHFLLAESARKLGKLDEAEQNYKRCLALDPVPKLKKASEKALKEMSGS